jgi:signal transduction histidine kinase
MQKHNLTPGDNEAFNLYTLAQSITQEVSANLKSGQKIILTYNGEKEVVQQKKFVQIIIGKLLTNVAQYSEEGKTLEFSVYAGSTLISIKVKDAGQAIPEEDQKDLFNQYFNESDIEGKQRRGLGLSIVSNYVNLLKGTISFVSTTNIGTTFTVQLPVIKAE